MTNIPTDLLRTFVSVVELRSFTRAAKAQGMTQPAVSAQIRRLQFLLGVELFDKSAPGVSLTPIGQNVIESARRLLSVNDHIVQMASPDSAAELVRLGVRRDCMGEQLVEMLAATRALATLAADRDRRRSAADAATAHAGSDRYRHRIGSR